jgi:hypothetical protein
VPWLLGRGYADAVALIADARECSSIRRQPRSASCI